MNHQEKKPFLSQNEKQPNLLFFYHKPGVYKMVCLSNGKTYIGETDNILERIRSHVSSLNDGTHDGNQLQKD